MKADDIATKADAQQHVQEIIDNIKEPKLREALQYVFDHRTQSYAEQRNEGNWSLGVEASTESSTITIGWVRW